MRVLCHGSFLVLAFAGLIHCGSDSGDPPVEGGDAGGRRDGATADSDTGADVVDGGEDMPLVDAGTCSADRWCRTTLPLKSLPFKAVWSFGADDVVASSTTKLLRWDGAEWTAANSPDSLGPTSLWATSDKDVW